MQWNGKKKISDVPEFLYRMAEEDTKLGIKFYRKLLQPDRGDEESIKSVYFMGNSLERCAAIHVWLFRLESVYDSSMLSEDEFKQYREDLESVQNKYLTLREIKDEGLLREVEEDLEAFKKKWRYLEEV